MNKKLEPINKVFNALDSWAETVKAFKRDKIVSYVVDPNCVEFSVKDGVMTIPPEAETVVSEIIRKANHI